MNSNNTIFEKKFYEVMQLWETSYKNFVSLHYMTNAEAYEMIANQLSLCNSMVKKMVKNISYTKIKTIQSIF